MRQLAGGLALGDVAAGTGGQPAVPSREKPRSLLVDDHAALRHGLALVLTEEGFGECREALGRDEALEATGREPPDLALLDLSLGAAATAAL